MGRKPKSETAAMSSTETGKTTGTTPRKPRKPRGPNRPKVRDDDGETMLAPSQWGARQWVAFALFATSFVLSWWIAKRQMESNSELHDILERVQPEVREMLSRAKAITGTLAEIDARVSKLEEKTVSKGKA